MQRFFDPRRIVRAALSLLATLGLALPAQAAIDPNDLQVLQDLYNGTNGSGWSNKTNWLTGDPCANHWYGITCDASQTHVTKIELVGNNLTGPLPSLSTLTSLTRFDVGWNSLTGPIPDFSAGPATLKYLGVQYNQLSGSIPDLTSLKALQYFSADHNLLDGTIGSITGLTELSYFSANQNHLIGSIPNLAGLTKLKNFDVRSNWLTGSIPDLSDLTSLYGFWADRNHLSGPIPSLSSLGELVLFMVYQNQLTGPLPNFTGLNKLQGFWANDNQITGTIPSDLSTLPQLYIIDLSNNRLTGKPPAAPLNLGGAALCPNLLQRPSPTDDAWNTAVGEDWWTDCPLVSATAGAGGSISPGGSVPVIKGQPATFTITPDAGYVIDTVGGSCGGSLSGNTWTTGAIDADCTVSVTFKARPEAAATPVPTLGEWALVLLGALLAGLGLRRLPRRQG